MSVNNNIHLMNNIHHDQHGYHLTAMGYHGTVNQIISTYQQQQPGHHHHPHSSQEVKPVHSEEGIVTNYFNPVTSIVDNDSNLEFNRAINSLETKQVKRKNNEIGESTEFKNILLMHQNVAHVDGLKKQTNNTKKETNENDGQSPNYFMNLFLDEYLINLLVDGTNWYINNVPRNRKDKIPSVTTDEVRCVLAIMYLSGYVDLPRVRMFWERAPDTSFPLVVDAIPRDRFETIFTNLHAAGSPSTDKKNPLSRISTLVDSLRDKFLQHAPSEDAHSVDELSVPYYKQATGLRQFTKTKTMKVWCGCTSSGYCVWFDQIDETQTESNSHTAANKIFTYASKMSYFKLSNASLIYDNIFNSIKIVDELRQLNIESKPVSNRISMAVSRAQKTPSSLEQLREQTKVHNSPMGGIDRLDQNINLYAITVIGKKWTSHFLLAYILDLTIQNAWQIYRKKNENCLDLLGFRRNIVTYYLTRYGKSMSSKGLGGKRKMTKKVNKHNDVRCKDVRYDGFEHYVIPQVKQTRCFHCKMKTMTRCCKCDVGLHVKCFINYHTRNTSDLRRIRCDISNNTRLDEEITGNLMIIE